MKEPGYHDLRNQRPPEGKQLMVIQSMGWKGVMSWPMRMSFLSGLWRWEPSGNPSSTYPTHWRRRVAGDERFDKSPDLSPRNPAAGGDKDSND